MGTCEVTQVVLMVIIWTNFAWAAPAAKHTIALLTEVNTGGNQKRELTLLPDTIKTKLTTDDETIYLNLERMRDIHAATPKLSFDQEKYNNIHYKGERHIGYYQDLQSMAAIMVEAKVQHPHVKRVMSGTLVHKNRMYELEPASEQLQSMAEVLEQRGLKEEQAHMVHTLKKVDKARLHPDQGVKRRMKKTRQDSDTEKTLLRLLKGFNNINQHRVKRQVISGQKIFHVEMMFVADYSVYQFYYQKKGNDHVEAMKEIKYHYTHTLNGMYMAYRSIQQSDFAIVLWLSEIYTITTPAEEIVTPAICPNGKCKEGDILNRMESFEKAKNFNWTYPDHLAYFTKRDMWAKEFETSTNYTVDLLGVCPFQAICVPFQSHCVNEDAGVISWHTAAHELAHNLGADHDGGQNTCDQSGTYIMAATDFEITQDVLNTAFTFSSCSIKAMKDLITGVGNNNYPRVCLYNTICVHNHALANVDELPGARYNKDNQCGIYYGNTAATESACSNSDICKLMTCKKPAEGHCGGNLRAAPGTPCGSSNKVCYNGQCVDKSTIQSPIDEISPSCSITSYTVSGCSDVATDCAATVMSNPKYCFLDSQTKDDCKKTCHQYRLFDVNHPKCTVTSQASSNQNPSSSAPTLAPPTNSPTTLPPPSTTPTPTTTTPPPASSCGAGQVKCLGQTSHQCIPVSAVWDIDMTEHCTSGSDESEQYIQQYCQDVPPATQCPAGQETCDDCKFMCVDDKDWECPGAYDKRQLHGRQAVSNRERTAELKNKLHRMLRMLRSKQWRSR